MKNAMLVGIDWQRISRLLLAVTVATAASTAPAAEFAPSTSGSQEQGIPRIAVNGTAVEVRWWEGEFPLATVGRSYDCPLGACVPTSAPFTLPVFDPIVGGYIDDIAFAGSTVLNLQVPRLSAPEQLFVQISSGGAPDPNAPLEPLAAGSGGSWYFPRACANGNGWTVAYTYARDESFDDVDAYVTTVDALGVPAATTSQVDDPVWTDQQFANAVACYADGSSFVVIQDLSGLDGSGEGVFGRIVSAAGVPQGDTFPINATTALGQSGAVVTITPGGRTFVAWSTNAPAIVVRELDSSGNPLTGEYTIPLGSSPGPQELRIASNDAELFLGYYLGGLPPNWAYLIRFDISSFTPIGQPIRISDRDDSVTDFDMAASGDLVVAAYAYNPKGPASEVVADAMIFGPTPTPTPTVTATPTPTMTPTATPDMGCPGPELTGCSVALSSTLKIVEPADPAKRKFSWSWKKGEASSYDDFADPTGSAAYRLCIYDGSSEIVRVDVPPAGMCSGKNCWSAKTGKSFAFKDKLGSNGGVSAMKLTAGVDGKAGLKVAGKGGNLADTTQPYAGPVTVQLINRSNNRCWGAQFANGEGVKANQDGLYSAKASLSVLP